MNWNDEQHDPLEELLRKAAWPEPRAEQLARLAGEWRGTVRRRKLRNASIIAAMVVPVAVLAWSLTWWPNVGREAINRAPTDSSLIAGQQRGALTPALSQRERVTEQVVREPTVYEQTLVLMQRHQIGLDRPIVTAATISTQQVTPLTSAMRMLIMNSLLEAGKTANRLAADVADLNSTLRAWHLRLQVAVNDAAEARKNSIDQLAIRTRAEASHERQRIWLAAILRRGSSGAVNAFLDLAGDPAIAPAAFEAAKEADSRTIDKLFEALQSRRVATRQTAAQVLGALNRPQVSQRLALMAMESSGRREALIGLLSSSDPVARKFVADAQHDSEIGPSLRALVRF